MYVRDYANTVLFLAHHTNDEFVLDTISDCLRGLFCQCTPVTLQKDTAIVAKLVEDAPKLVYSGRTPEDSRKVGNQIRDELDNGDDGLRESEESTPSRSLVAELTMLDKTVEILGQVLKNQYSKIPRTQKVELITELFLGPLRALRNFWDYLEKSPDTLVTDIENALRLREKTNNEEIRKKVARTVVAAIVEMVTFSMFRRAAFSANADSLVEDVHDVIKRNESLAFRIIELFITLDSPRAIPRSQIKRLHLEANHDLLASRLIRIMVLYRLYMFKTSEKDMQWLAETLGFDMNTAHALGYQNAKLGPDD